MVVRKVLPYQGTLIYKCEDLLNGSLKLLITKEAFNELINCPIVPPETGGILLGNSSIIDIVIFDSGIKEHKNSGIKYIPNVKFLNECLSIYSKQGKRFLGMFHTHARQWKNLSNDDIHYIKNVMRAMPLEIKYLYFPLVFPGENIKAYKAQKKSFQIIINKEEIEQI